MAKVIKLTESDLIKIVKKVINEQVKTVNPLPILPDGRLYKITDFIDSTAGWNVADLPKILGKKVNILYYGEGGGMIDDAIKNNDIDTLCKIIGNETNRGGARPILYPITKSGSPAKYPPAKYICQKVVGGGAFLKLVPIGTFDAEIIATKRDGVDYLRTVDKSGKPYLINKRSLS